MVFDGKRRHRGQTMRFQETLRRLAMIDEGFVEDQAGLGLGPAWISALDPRTAALLRLGVSVATGERTWPERVSYPATRARLS